MSPQLPEAAVLMLGEKLKGLGVLPEGNGWFDVRGAHNGSGYSDGGHEHHRMAAAASEPGSDGATP